MLRLVAQYADVWNTVWHVDPKVVKERYAEFKEICASEGRNPATIELTAGTIVRLTQSAEANPIGEAISGTPEEIAHQLQGFADVGVTHLMVIVGPSGVASIEQFGRVVELMHNL
jgi:alkanesulfonate monooxygenase SsuD/methylene tetrahydromethanopterin reductase-like flavin-dependent oxidoreductase (luciferase family)